MNRLQRVQNWQDQVIAAFPNHKIRFATVAYSNPEDSVYSFEMIVSSPKGDDVRFVCMDRSYERDLVIRADLGKALEPHGPWRGRRPPSFHTKLDVNPKRSSSVKDALAFVPELEQIQFEAQKNKDAQDIREAQVDAVKNRLELLGHSIRFRTPQYTDEREATSYIRSEKKVLGEARVNCDSSVDLRLYDLPVELAEEIVSLITRNK